MRERQSLCVGRKGLSATRKQGVRAPASSQGEFVGKGRRVALGGKTLRIAPARVGSLAGAFAVTRTQVAAGQFESA